MNRDSYINSNGISFSLPSGFFQNSGGGSIGGVVTKGLQKKTSVPNSSQSKNSARSLPQNKMQGNLPKFIHNQYSSNNNQLNILSKKNQSENNFGRNVFQNPNQGDQRINIQPANQQPQTPQRKINHQQKILLQSQNHPNLPPHLRPKPLQYQAPKALEYHQVEQEDAEAYARESYYTNILVTGIVGILLYLIGAFIIIFLSNVGGETIVNLPNYNLSWELLFSNPGKFVSHSFLTVFGYFFQYARLYGFFPELGNLTVEAVPRYLMPVDILIKLGTVLYFHLNWMPWDTKRFFRLGIFSRNYPYLSDKEKSKVTQKPSENFKIDSINIPEEEIFKIEAQNQHRESLLKAKNDLKLKNFKLQQSFSNNNHSESEEEDENYSLLPFSGVQKPLEEWYLSNEQNIYSIIRTRVLPGLNLGLAFYFSTLGVLQLNRPVGILIYFLGIMSMFWCMQTFLLILDHVHYPVEEDGE